MMRPHLNFNYLHTGQVGFSNHGIETHDALTRIGVDVFDGLPGSGDEDLDLKDQLICRDILYLSTPAHVAGWWKGQRKHLFTMWETDTLPISMRELDNFDTIIVPSEECRALYSQYHANVKRVPLGVNTSRWRYVKRRTPDVSFTFLTAGSGTRKGSDLVYKAFNELFPNGQAPSPELPIPRLIVKSPAGEDYQGENIVVINGYLSPEEEVGLYASANCYVQASRGEGWGMQPLQAMAQGCPTILTDAHGHTPFAQYGIPIPATRAKADMELFGESGDWWEPDFRALKKAMWDVYSNYETFHQPYAALQSEIVRQLFTWEESAQAIVEAIGGLDALRERWHSGEGPTEFIVPEHKLFRIITKRDFRPDIGGTVRFFAEGAEYWVPRETKQVLTAMNILDPACLADDEGVSPSHSQRRDSEVAQ